MGKNQSVGKGHTKWLGGPGCGLLHTPVLGPHELCKTADGQ